ncbi:tail fiber protein [Paenibacillus lautus]|uniref:tail fiber protein n=1 Tax=Paenibacillus lautus TaxID=1401 RepID=UPI00384E50D0
MSSFSAKGLTNKGRSLQAKAQAGAELRYTKFVIGDGQLGGQSISALTNVISPKKTIDVTRLKPTPPNQATVGFVLSNQDVTTGFFFREIGLYAMDPDDGEVLYFYLNAGDTADYIPPTGTGDVINKNFDILVYVGQAQNVTLTVDTDLAYVTHKELEEALEGLDPDIPPASLTQPGIVQLSNATNGTRENVAPTEKALKAAYDRGSEGVTAAAAAQSKADAAETPAGAQAKANAAETNAKNYVDGKTWQKQRLTSDSGSSLNLATGTNLNNIRTTGFYDGSGLVNAPGDGWFYYEVQSHSSNPGAWTIQKAHDFNNNTYYQRTCTNGTWSAWQELFQSVANGKQAIATAISGKGISASGSDEFAVLANKISQIPVGVKYATGNIGIIYAQNSQPVDCGFVPRVFVVSGLVQGFGSRAATYIYLTADGIVRLDSYGGTYLYITSTSLQQVMTIRANNPDRYVQNVIWEAWA